MQAIQVQIVDTDLLFIDTLKTALSQEKDIDIIGHVSSCKLAMEKCVPGGDVCCIVGDHLTGMNAAEFVEKISQGGFSAHNIIIATYNGNREQEKNEAGLRTIAALSLGAFDCFVKPSSRETNPVDYLRRIVLPKIRCLSIKRYSQRAKNGQLHIVEQTRVPSILVPPPPKMPPGKVSIRRPDAHFRYEVCIIGVSTGGPEALMALLPALPASLPIPVFVVLHMPKGMTKPMAELLAARSSICVKEAQDNETLLPEMVYIAPGGVHSVFERITRNRLLVKTNDGPQENGVKPAVDVLFRSAAAVVKEKSFAIILTGMGIDGLRGIEAYKGCSIPVIAQDEATSVVWGMPGSVVKAGLASEVLPLRQIAGRIIELGTMEI